MAVLTVKNLPDSLYEKLARVARRDRRSLNSEAIVALEEGLRQIDGESEQVLDRIRDRRQRLAGRGVFVNDDLLNKTKGEGRP